MKKLHLFLLGIIILKSSMYSQEIISKDEILLRGFAEKNSGNDFAYATTIPGYKGCLLIRVTTGNQIMEWKTEAVPENQSQKDVVFLWLAGMGSNLGITKMILTVNDDDELDFSTEDVLIVSAKPISNSTLLLQRGEVNGKNAELSILRPDKSGDYKLQQSDVTGELIADPDPKLYFKPYETKFLRINLEDLG